MWFPPGWSVPSHIRRRSRRTAHEGDGDALLCPTLFVFLFNSLFDLAGGFWFLGGLFFIYWNFRYWNLIIVFYHCIICRVV